MKNVKAKAVFRAVGLCLGVSAFLFCSSSALAITWTNTVKDGWYWPVVGTNLSATGITHYVQVDDNDPTNANPCFAGNGATIANRKWFSVYFTNDFPSSAAMSSVRIYVQNQLRPSSSSTGTMFVYVSTNQDLTKWKAGLTNNYHARSPGIPVSLVEQEYIYDVTSVLDTPEKINNCEILLAFGSSGGPTHRLYFDYIKIEVDYADPGPPVMGNGVGGSSVSTNSATFNGAVLEGGPSPLVYLCRGDDDAGTVWSNWDRRDSLGSRSIGPFSTNVTGLVANKTYYYRCYGTNVYGYDFADETASFTTLPPTVQFTLTTSSGLESVTPADLQVSLSVTSAVDVTVLYAVTGGTASNLSDYSIAGSMLTIPAGAASASIPVTIINDVMDENNETIEITLSDPTGANRHCR